MPGAETRLTFVNASDSASEGGLRVVESADGETLVFNQDPPTDTELGCTHYFTKIDVNSVAGLREETRTGFGDIMKRVLVGNGLDSDAAEKITWLPATQGKPNTPVSKARILKENFLHHKESDLTFYIPTHMTGMRLFIVIAKKSRVLGSKPNGSMWLDEQHMFICKRGDKRRGGGESVEVVNRYRLSLDSDGDSSGGSGSGSEAKKDKTDVAGDGNGDGVGGGGGSRSGSGGSGTKSEKANVKKPTSPEDPGKSVLDMFYTAIDLEDVSFK